LKTKYISLAAKQNEIGGMWFMVFKTTFNNILVISWLSVLLVEETRKKHRPVAGH
jgi:hypothetical protein